MRLVHVVISPDPSLVESLEDFDALRSRAFSYLYTKSNYKAHGCILFHPFRANKRYYAERREERRDDEENIDKELKKWEWIRNKENWYDYVEFSPHFHFVGYIGWLKEPLEGEEFIYKLIRGKNGYREMQNKRELFKLAYYLLSHSAYSPSLHIHNHIWIGNLSYRKKVRFRLPSKKPSEEKRRCKICGGPLFFFKPNLKAFFKGWFDLDLFKDPLKEAKLIVLHARIPAFSFFR